MSYIYVLFGPSGCGKNTIAEMIKEEFQCKKFVTDTTRKPREGEINHKDYNFVTKEEFLKGIEQSDYVEYTNYSGNFYGSRKASYEELLNQGENILLIMDIKGVLKLKELFPEKTKSVFIKSSFESLRERMINRGDSLESVNQRLKHLESTGEFDNEKYADIVIFNDGDLEFAKQQIKQIREI